jgi:hypothetical protein
MGDPIRKPAKPRPATRVRASRAQLRRRRPGRLERAYLLLDFMVTRLLVVAVTLAILRGQVTKEAAAAIWASYWLLRATRWK